MALAPVARAFFVPVSYARTYFFLKTATPVPIFLLRSATSVPLDARTCFFFYLLPLTYLDDVIT